MLINGEALEEMDKLIAKGIVVDAIICDPPYGTTSCKWDSVIPFEAMWERLNKLIKPNGAIVLFGSEPFSSLLRVSNLDNYKYDWIWHKNSSGGFILAKKQPMKYHEIVSVFYKEQCIYNPQMEEYADSTKSRYPKNGTVCNSTKENTIHSIQSIDHHIDISHGKYPSSVQKFDNVPNANGNRVHPTQKPIELMEYLIKTYTNENELVLDFTMGSGSTGVACVNAGREFIGIELDKDYFKIASDRIEKVQLKKDTNIF